MFLSMLVAWMIPDVPRSLREQLKKENMALMEFLLEQDQEACAKTLSPKRSIPCFPANIDIVVEEAPEEEVVCQVGEKKEEVCVEISLDEPGRFDTDMEVYKSLEEAENKEYEPGGEECEGGFKMESKDEKENGEARTEGTGEKDQTTESNEGEVYEAKASEEENFTVDLDSFMSDLGLLGKMSQLSLFFDHLLDSLYYVKSIYFVLFI